jgi:hypothetical protein
VKNTLHSAATCEWGTNPELTDFSRHVLGRIDLDPCSSVDWNQKIGAWRIITEREDCRITPWVIGGPLPLRSDTCPDGAGYQMHCHINPPGDPRGVLVAFCWQALTNYIDTGWITAAIWIGFSIEQLARLQKVQPGNHPLQYPTLMLAGRPEFMKSPGIAGKEPSHASFVTLLGGDDAMLRRFVDSDDLGTVVVPYRKQEKR